MLGLGHNLDLGASNLEMASMTILDKAKFFFQQVLGWHVTVPNILLY